MDNNNGYLVKGNLAYKRKDYISAIHYYKGALTQSSELKNAAQFNINYIEKKIGKVEEKNLSLTNKLSPVSAIEKLQEKYKSTSEDPHFEVNLSELKIEKGFYIWSSEIETEAVATINQKLYFSSGDEYSEENTACLTSKSGHHYSRLIYFENTIKKIRYDPLETAADFNIKKLTLTPTTETFAIKLMQMTLTESDRNSKTLYKKYSARFLPVAAASVSYSEWINTIEKNTHPTAAQIKSIISSMHYKPVISVVMPTYNTDEKYLRLCIDSVIKQSYPHWELCVADDKSPKPHVIQVLQEYANKDSRIKFIKRTENGHISKATNSAIELATGDFIALLDHDDELAEHALLFMAEAINKHPSGQVFYSDEDKIDKNGLRSDPHFKSDWNPDLFFSQNYVSHLGVYKADLIKKIGGFRAGVEGSQDQDLLLRCLPHVKNDQIHHIPKVLYHWRMLEGSTALASGEKSYTTVAGIKALQDYFSKNGPAGTTVQAGLVPNTYKVNWPLPDNAPKVSLLIPTRDRKTITEVAVRSILEKTTYPNYEIVILDNGSIEPETLAFFNKIQQEDSRVRVLRYDYPFNYSAINNFGVKHTNGELVGLINNDIEVINPEWLTEMVSHAIRPEIGCVGAKLYYSNGQIQHAGVICSLGGVAGHSHKYFPKDHPGYFHRLLLVQNLSAVTAAVLIVRRKIYNKVNGLDEKNLKVAFNDVDFCLKVRRAGYRNLWTPYAELYHHESISRGHEDTPEKQVRFKAEVDYMKSTWKNELNLDPYYSINLTKDREDFSIGSNNA